VLGVSTGQKVGRVDGSLVWTARLLGTLEKKVYTKYFKDNYKLNTSNALYKDKKKTLFSVFKSLFIVYKANNSSVSLKA
jgi:hypothetical protein